MGQGGMKHLLHLRPTLKPLGHGEALTLRLVQAQFHGAQAAQGEEALQRVGARSLLVADAAGVHYLVRDITALDRASRKYLERFL